MEALTRLVADSLARHGLDRSVDPRRLQWSRWYRCDSPRSLLVVPSKPGIFALAEEIMDLGSSSAHVGTDAFVRPANEASAPATGPNLPLGSAALPRCDSSQNLNADLAAEARTRRMLAVLQFSEDDDMAFTLDRMFTRVNPMRTRLASGRCFLRYVAIQDRDQRGTICAALNQWLLTSAEKATGFGADFSSSLELNPATDRVGTGDSPVHVNSSTAHVGTAALGSPAEQSSAIPAATTAAPPSSRTLAVSPMQNFIRPVSRTAPPHLDSGAAKNLHCPQPLPSGF
jgi:hypothetical protein